MGRCALVGPGQRMDVAAFAVPGWLVFGQGAFWAKAEMFSMGHPLMMFRANEEYSRIVLYSLCPRPPGRLKSGGHSRETAPATYPPRTPSLLPLSRLSSFCVVVELLLLRAENTPRVEPPDQFGPGQSSSA